MRRVAYLAHDVLLDCRVAIKELTVTAQADGGGGDMHEQAEALVARLAGLPAHVNLIRLNPTPNYVGQPSTLAAIEAFTAVLNRAQVPHTMW